MSLSSIWLFKNTYVTFLDYLNIDGPQPYSTWKSWFSRLCWSLLISRYCALQQTPLWFYKNELVHLISSLNSMCFYFLGRKLCVISNFYIIKGNLFFWFCVDFQDLSLGVIDFWTTLFCSCCKLGIFLAFNDICEIAVVYHLQNLDLLAFLT